MNLAPYSASRYMHENDRLSEEDDFLAPIEPKNLELRPTFSGDYFSKLVQFPVIVERYDKLCGSKKRRYQQEFSEQERRLIAKWYSKFYHWYLVTGTPQRVQLKLGTVQLLQRAVNFFAGV